MLHTTFSCSRLTSGSLHSNQPVRRRSVWWTRALTCSAVNSPGQPVTSA
ncbi:hypothetical protein ACFQZC_32450 [Streptacidiphilus monticola]